MRSKHERRIDATTCVTAGVILVLLAVGARANEAPPATDESLEDIDLLALEVPTVVTASRHEQKITDVPYAVSVITAEDIRLSGARSIPDALRLVPGVDVADLSYATHAVSPRGLNGILAGATLVLVDGRQIYDSLYGGTFWGSWPFQLEDIERIEVIRGPGGVTWGANAVNGVINIITKDPADQLGLTVTGRGGSRGSHKEHLGYAFADKKLRLRVSGEYEASDGFRAGVSPLFEFDDNYKTGRMGVHAIYQASPDDTLTFSGGSSVVQDGYPPSLAGAFGREKANSNANFLLAKWAHQIEPDSAFELTGYVNDFYLKTGTLGAEYRYQQFALQARHTFKPADGHTLTWGIDTRADITDSGNSGPDILSKTFVGTGIIGLYVQDQWRFAPQWVLDLGARIDYEFYTGFEPSARAALSYEFTDNSVVYGAVSRAFATCGAIRFTDTPLLDDWIRLTENPGIEPMHLMAYELGYRGRFFDRLDVSANAYWHEYEGLGASAFELSPHSLLQYKWDNRASASLYGVELEGKYAVTDRLMLLGNYTYEQMRWRPADLFGATDFITPPQHKFMVGARYSPTEDLHLSSHLYFVDRVKAPNAYNPLWKLDVPSYFRLDLRAEYEFWDDRASVAVGVSNLLDPGHPEAGSQFFGHGEVPRMVYAEMRVSFQ
jgi:iron complex outermembrane receptor protein